MNGNKASAQGVYLSSQPHAPSSSVDGSFPTCVSSAGPLMLVCRGDSLKQLSTQINWGRRLRIHQRLSHLASLLQPSLVHSDRGVCSFVYILEKMRRHKYLSPEKAAHFSSDGFSPFYLVAPSSFAGDAGVTAGYDLNIFSCYHHAGRTVISREASKRDGES